MSNFQEQLIEAAEKCFDTGHPWMHYEVMNEDFYSFFVFLGTPFWDYTIKEFNLVLDSGASDWFLLLCAEALSE